MALTKVSSSLVSDNAVTSGKIADGGIATADIADVAVTTAKIANNAILTQHIDDGQVTTAQLGAYAVTADKIDNDAISEEHLDITVITSLSAVTAATGDLLMVADVSDSNNLKKIPVSSILAGTHTGPVNSTGAITLGASALTLNGSLGTWSVNSEGARMNFGRGSANYIDAVHESGFLVFQTSNGETALTLNTSQNATFAGTINSGAITASADINVVESGNAKIVVNSVGDFFPSLEIKRTSGSSKSNYAWNFQIGSSGFLNLIDGTNSYYGAIFKNNGDIALSNDTDSTNPVLLLDKSAESATFAGDISIPVGNKLYFGGSNHTYIAEDIDDRMRFFTGGDEFMRFTEGTTDSVNIYKDTIFSGNLHAGDDTDISMDANANGQLEVDGNGYQGAIALDGSAMHVYHNSSSRGLVLGTNETARITIGGSGGVNFHSNNLTSIGTLTLGSASNVAAANAAADDFVIKGVGTAVGLTISQDSQAGTGTIFFGDPVSSSAAGFRYNHNTGDMAISAEDNITFACDNVGIGTTTPDATLKVVSSTAGSAGAWIRADNYGLRVSAGSTASHYALRIANSSDATLATFNGDGKVGIGTSSPVHKLDVRDGTIFAGRLVSDEGSISYTNTAAAFSSRGVDHDAARSNVLRLLRDGTSGVQYAGVADFDLESWETSGVHSRTAMILKLGHGNLPDTPEVMTWRSNGNVGIGTTSPGEKLSILGGHISVGDSSGVTGTEFLLEGYREIYNGSKYGNISIRSTYNPGTNASDMLFYTASGGQNTAERMRIDSSGNLIFNGSANLTSNTSDGSDNAQIVIAGGGSTVSADTRGASIHLAGNENGNGGLLQLRAGSGSVGGIRLYSGGSERLRVTDNGITFNADTAAANALDDYEEGEFTLVLSGATTAGSQSGGSSGGRYTKIGRVVTLSVVIANTTLSGAAGTIKLTGFPFVPANYANRPAIGVLRAYNQNFASPSDGYFSPTLSIEHGVNHAVLVQTKDNGTWSIVAIENSGSLYFEGAVTYITS
jgi:hypothetical protein